jgi:hypothetical protein
MRTLNRIGGAVKLVQGVGIGLCCAAAFMGGSVVWASLAVVAAAYAGNRIAVGVCELLTGWVPDDE